jgi:hypothetical protein
LLRPPTIDTARVSQIDADALLGRCRKAHALQPATQARAPAGRIHDEVGLEHVRGFDRVARLDTHTAHGSPRRDQRGGLHAIAHAHVRHALKSLAQVPLEQRAAQQQRAELAREVRELSTFVEEAHVLAELTIDRAAREELGDRAREHVVEGLSPTAQQPVRMVALRNAPARLRRQGESIAFQHGHVLEVIAQYARSHEPTHTRAKNDCMLA